VRASRVEGRPARGLPRSRGSALRAPAQADRPRGPERGSARSPHRSRHRWAKRVARAPPQGLGGPAALPSQRMRFLPRGSRCPARQRPACSRPAAWFPTRSLPPFPRLLSRKAPRRSLSAPRSTAPSSRQPRRRSRRRPSTAPGRKPKSCRLRPDPEMRGRGRSHTLPRTRPPSSPGPSAYRSQSSPAPLSSCAKTISRAALNQTMRGDATRPGPHRDRTLNRPRGAGCMLKQSRRAPTARTCQARRLVSQLMAERSA
jgi:hypothetical protein